MRAYALPLLAVAALVLGPACFSTPVDETDAGTDPNEPIICDDDDQCPERSICRGGLCQDVGEGCASKEECTGGFVCVDGVCADPPAVCSSSDECPGELLCDGFSGSCIDPNATGCQVDGDCILEPGCAGGCVCLPNGQCIADTGFDAGPQPDGGAPPPPQDAGPPPVGGSIDLGGFTIENREHDPPIQVGVIPDGVVLTSGQHLVIGRNATEASFEDFWQVSFGSDVVYLNAGAENAGIPIINGDESWAVLSPVGTLIDGPTATGNQNRCFHRVNDGPSTDPNTWAWDNASNATPGSTDITLSGVGLVVSQWSDASGGGAHPFEFLQLTWAP
jgi:hypothetical protein